jgi:hypothetical protein
MVGASEHPLGPRHAREWDQQRSRHQRPDPVPHSRKGAKENQRRSNTLRRAVRSILQIGGCGSPSSVVHTIESDHLSSD